MEKVPLIDFKSIPAVSVHNLSKAFCEAVQAFYDNPDNRKRFENWKANQKQAD